MYRYNISLYGIILLCWTMAMMLFITACSPTESPRAVQQLALLNTTTVLAMVESKGIDVGPAISPSDVSKLVVHFSETGKGVAYVMAGSNGYRVVHRNQPGPLVQSLDAIVLSHDGTRIAYSAQRDGNWGMYVDGVHAGRASSVTDPSFSPDGRHLAFGLRREGKWYLVVDGREVLDGQSRVDAPAFSGDSARIIYAAQKDVRSPLQLFITDMANKALFTIDNCGNGLIVSPDKKRFAAIEEAATHKRVIVASFLRPESLERGKLYDDISGITFSADGRSVAYMGLRNGKRYVILDGREEEYPQGNIPGSLAIRYDHKGVAFIISTQPGYYLHQAFMPGNQSQQKMYEAAEGLAVNPVTNKHAFAARRGDKWFVVSDGTEGPQYDRVVSPLYSPDGSVLVYRVRQGNDRFVVAVNQRGERLKHLQSYEMVQQPIFLDDNKIIGYGVKDGNKLTWRVDKLQ